MMIDKGFNAQGRLGVGSKRPKLILLKNPCNSPESTPVYRPSPSAARPPGTKSVPNPEFRGTISVFRSALRPPSSALCLLTAFPPVLGRPLVTRHTSLVP